MRKSSRSKPRVIVKGQLDFLGRFGTRNVYYIHALDKYWMAPYGVSVYTAFGGKLEYLRLKIKLRGDNKDKCFLLSNIQKADFTQLIDEIATRALPVFQQYGCYRWMPDTWAKLYSKKRYANRVMVHCIPKRVEGVLAGGVTYVGSAYVDEPEKIQRLVEIATEKSLLNRDWNTRHSVLPLQEAFILLDSNPLSNVDS